MKLHISISIRRKDAKNLISTYIVYIIQSYYHLIWKPITLKPMQVFSQNLVDIYKVLSVEGQRIKAHNFTPNFDKRMDGVGG